MKEDAVPATVSLRDLLQEFANAHREEAADGHWSAPRIEFETSEYGSGSKFIRVYFDEEPEGAYADARSTYSSRPARSLHELKNHLGIAVKGTNAAGHEFGDVFSARLEGERIGRHFSLYNKWKRLIAALYFGEANLVIDCDADEISYGLDD